MGHTLKNDDAVHCTTKEQYGRILDLAKKAGVPVYCNLRDNDFVNYPFVGWDGHQLDGEDPCGKSDLNIIPEAEFVARMFGVDATPKDGPTIADLEARIAELDEKIAANQKEIERLEASLNVAKETKEGLKLFEYRERHMLSWNPDLSGPLYIGQEDAPASIRGKCLILNYDYDMEVIEYEGRKIFKFYRK